MNNLPALTTALFFCCSSAFAQEAGEAYHSQFRTLGFMIRATYACPIDKRKALSEIGNGATPDSKAFAQAFPKTIQKWMEEGADLFNNGVMKTGITKACAAIH